MKIRDYTREISKSDLQLALEAEDVVKDKPLDTSISLNIANAIMKGRLKVDEDGWQCISLLTQRGYSLDVAFKAAYAFRALIIARLIKTSVSCPASPSGQHETINVGFRSRTMACKHCGNSV